MQTENEVWNQERLKESITEIMVLSFCSSIAAWFLQGQQQSSAIIKWPPPEEVNSTVVGDPKKVAKYHKKCGTDPGDPGDPGAIEEAMHRKKNTSRSHAW